MGESVESDEAPRILTTRVYGFKDRARVSRLIEALQQIPCCPSLIFRINARGTNGDRFAKMLGVDDILTGETYYVRVIRWGGRSKPPVIGWSLDPRRYSRALASKSRDARVEYESALGLRGMVVNYDASQVVRLCEKRTLVAS